ncbi:MAG: phosphoribosylformylglycinamidine cyclo-ligase [Chloroflexi bacterium]|nr:phosphoribosylformylglycinamidine cyclo-ligase [Chloroflexota bacterium]
MAERRRWTYASAGVDAAQVERGLHRLLPWVRQTHDFGSCETLLPIGYFANVLRLTPDLSLAISTDSIGTKAVLARQLGRYDTAGIDCVAMNVNDVLCVGAEPIALVDYVAVDAPNDDALEAIGRGLFEGARRANVSIPGGELAVVPELVQAHGGDSMAFDLVGTAIGLVHPDRIITGADLAEGDIVIGLGSSGIHSNGLTLARRVLAGSDPGRLREHVPSLDRTIGDELLEPTRIYVPEVLALLRASTPVRALYNVTGDGFLNMLRSPPPVSFELIDLPQVPPIFGLIQERGGVSDEEMYRVFNMGIGFCVVVAEAAAAGAEDVLVAAGAEPRRIGHVRADGRREVRIPTIGLIGSEGAFRRA